MPLYLCAEALDSGSLVELTSPVGQTSLNYHLVWAASALRKSRVAHARQTILWNMAR
ncbi:hypothetical protein IB233_06305 [Comamonas sp. CMM01]|uniref:hypothetical protein n=1 Tax=Comamonas sp. CMM01 TaxID=2769280 RepID=UPI0017855EF6|nr:hypothetical protein [Comamonas sp. CMM01]MBD9531225.1 hypothetical protein [Comamonas sp. CMM01]